MAEAKKAEPKKPEAKKAGTRRKWSPEQKKKILAEAFRGNMTGEQVQKKYGIYPSQYYAWKKNASAQLAKTKRPHRSTKTNGSDTAAGGLLATLVRQALKEIITDELNSAR